MNGILFKKYNASLLQCSQKVSFCPETGKILFSYHSRAADPWFCPLTFLYPNRLVPKCFGFLSFWGNSGPALGRKLTFFDHCIDIMSHHKSLMLYTLRSVTMSGQYKYRRNPSACKIAEDSSTKKHGQWSSKKSKKGLVLYLYWPLTVTLLRVYYFEG